MAVIDWMPDPLYRAYVATRRFLRLRPGKEYRFPGSNFVIAAVMPGDDKHQARLARLIEDSADEPGNVPAGAVFDRAFLLREYYPGCDIVVGKLRNP